MPFRAPAGPAGQPDVAEALRARNAQFDMLNRLSALISQAENLDPALETAVAELLSFAGADMGSIHVVDAQTASLRLVASRGVSRGFVCAERRIPVGECLCGEAARTGLLVASDDLTSEPRLVRPACRDEKFGSVISVPLTSRDRSLGILTIYARRPRAFSDIDRELFLLVGRQIGVAIENAQLAVRTRELAVLEERSLMAQEIHDGIAQSLAYLNLQMRRLKEAPPGDPSLITAELEQMHQVTTEAYDEARELLVDFRTKFRDGEGLSQALSRHLEEFSRRTGIRTRLAGESDAGSLPTGSQMPLFRIIQEALSNVRKHAGAQEAIVTLAAEGPMLQAMVSDDGRGFNIGAPGDSGSTHLGLEIMRERAARVGGVVRIESQPDRGTTVLIRIPLGAPAGSRHAAD